MNRFYYMSDNTENKDFNKLLKAIRCAANIGLWGSLLLLALTIAEHYLDRYVWLRTIVMDEYSRHKLLIIGLIMVVADVAAVLLTIRKDVPRLRQLENIELKLKRYKSLVQMIYLGTLFIVLSVCVIIVVTHENTLIMVLLLLFVTLMLNFPNMYKMKTDLGLNDDEMKSLFGDKYIK